MGVLARPNENSLANTAILSFAGGGSPYVYCDTETYNILARVIFQGTNVSGAPTALKVVSATDNSSGIYGTKITREDTGAVIAEITGQTNTSFQVKDLGAISNLPTDEVVFEIQAKVNKKPYEVQISSLMMVF